MENFARKTISHLPEYIPGKQVDEVVKEFNLKEAIKLASNENPFGVPLKAQEAIKKHLNFLHIYPDQHHISLREALAEKFSIRKENIIMGNGSDEIMLLIAQTFLSASQEVVISTHTFSMYEFVTKLMDGSLVLIDLKNYHYDLESILSAINFNTKIIFLCNPNNPTGTFFTEKQFASFIERIPDHVVIVVDEAYGEFADSCDFPKTIEYIKKNKNIILLKTFSKAYGLAGIRVGYGISSPQIIKLLNLAKLPFNVNRLALVAAIEALKDQEFLNKTLANNIAGKSYLYSELDTLNVKYLKTQANFIFVDLNRDCDEVFVELLKKGIIVRPLKTFGFPKAIRVSIGLKEQNEKFISALRQILK